MRLNDLNQFLTESNFFFHPKNRVQMGQYKILRTGKKRNGNGILVANAAVG